MTDHVDTADTIISLRVNIIVNTNGEWAAYGYRDDDGTIDVVLYDMMEGRDADSTRPFHLVADFPLPNRGSRSSRIFTRFIVGESGAV